MTEAGKNYFEILNILEKKKRECEWKVANIVEKKFWNNKGNSY